MTTAHAPSQSSSSSSEGTPPGRSSPTQSVGTVVKSSGLIVTPGLWFSREARSFVLVGENPKTTPLCQFVASLPGPFTLISNDTKASEGAIRDTAKSHVDSLGLQPAERQQRDFNVIIGRVSSGGTWLDLDDGSLVSVPNFREQDGTVQIVSRARGEQPAFRRLSAEQIPSSSDPDRRESFVTQMAELATRSGFGSIINF